MGLRSSRTHQFYNIKKKIILAYELIYNKQNLLPMFPCITGGHRPDHIMIGRRWALTSPVKCPSAQLRATFIALLDDYRTLFLLEQYRYLY